MSLVANLLQTTAMTIARPLAGLFGVAGTLVQSISDRFDDLLSSEETAGNDNVFYNPQDLTSLRVGTDGSGGSPAVGDPVGTMLDTSGLAGSMEEFLGGQPELVTNGTFDTDTTGWASGNSATLSVVSQKLRVTGTGVADPYAVQAITTEAGKSYIISLDHVQVSTSANIRAGTTSGGFDLLNGGMASDGSFEFVFTATGTTTYISLKLNTSATVSADFDNISIKEIPGNHAIAPTDAARPTLMDDPDTTWSSLTDDGTRGEEILDNPDFVDGTNSWVLDTSNGTGTLTESGGVLTLAGTGSVYITAYQQVTGLELGAEYEFIVVIGSNTDTPAFRGARLAWGLTPTPAEVDVETASAQITPGTYTVTSRARATSLTVGLQVNGSASISISSFSVRKVNTAFDERGGELVIPSNWTAPSANWTIDAAAGTVEKTATDANSFDLSGSTETGKFYEYEITVSGLSGGSPSLKDGGGGSSFITISANGTYRGFYQSSAGNPMVIVGNLATFTISNISVKEVPYPNLLLASNGSDDDSTFDTDTGNWGKDAGISIGSGVATFNTAGSGDLYYSNLLTLDKWYKVTFYVSRYVSGNIRLNAQRDDTGIAPIITPAVGWYTLYGRAVSTLFKIGSAVASDYDIDNVIIQELPSTTPTSYYLDTDGTDDWMQVTPTLDLGEQWWHTGAWQSDTSGKYPFGTSSAFISGPRDISGDWNWYNSASALQIICTSDTATKHVLTVEQADTNSLVARFNGVQEVDPITPADDSGGIQGLALFNQRNTTYGAGLDGRFYGGAWGQGQVDYDELTTLQDYLGTLVEPDINPTDVTKYDDVYQMLSAQTAAALFDIDDTTSLRVETDGSGGVPVDGDPVGLMMDVSGAGGSTMAAYLAGATELVTNGTFDTDTSGWSGVNSTLSIASGALRVTSTTGVSYARLDSFSVEAGKVYSVSADVSNIGGTKAQLWVGSGYGVADWLLIDNVTADSTITGIFTATTANAYLELVGNTSTGQSTDWDNVSIKELPGYVATAPSDAARPTLASVLDETASELTDDGTRGPELVTNGDFDTDITGWGDLGSWTAGSAVWTSGTIDVTVVSYQGVAQVITTEVGTEYEVTFDVVSVSGGDTARIYVGPATNPSASAILNKNSLSPGSYTYTFRATSASHGLGLSTTSGGNSAVWDNISVKKVQTVFDGRGDELVPNQFGDGWAFDPSATVLNEQVTASSVLGNIAYYYSPTLFGVPRTLEVTFTISNYVSGSVQPRVGATNAFSAQSANGTFTEVATVDGSYEYLNMFGSSFTGTISDISVKEVLTPNLLLTSAGDDDSTFDTDTGNWNVAAASNWSITGGALVADGSASNNVGYSLPIIESYKWYRVMLYISAVTGSVKVRLGSSGINDALLSTTGWHTVITQSESTGFALRCNAGETVTIDNVIVQEVPASVARAFYLDFDGVDDNLILDGTDFGSSTNATLYKTFRGDSTDNNQVMFGTTSGLTFTYILAAESGSTSTGFSDGVGSPVYREDGVIASYADRDALFTALVDNTDHTIGVEEADLSVSSKWVNDGFYIGGEYSSDWDNTGRLYSWAAVDTRLDGRNRDLLENFMISKKTS